ncbi:hypothetical protein N658DRAFT_52546 [Parathielavia hyrcaniae]|uniref:Uncharacterized protein n=1 Tax=Parathielavia hyrcaniae TaxID=113614 RepID=A0AAN6Q175_9PEZI|nr:hypothetical protein N658DRAFT_52546 [Parathielavia hyrcaniae]
MMYGRNTNGNAGQQDHAHRLGATLDPRLARPCRHRYAIVVVVVNRPPWATRSWPILILGCRSIDLILLSRPPKHLPISSNHAFVDGLRIRPPRRRPCLEIGWATAYPNSATGSKARGLCDGMRSGACIVCHAHRVSTCPLIQSTALARSDGAIASMDAESMFHNGSGGSQPYYIMASAVAPAQARAWYGIPGTPRNRRRYGYPDESPSGLLRRCVSRVASDTI